LDIALPFKDHHINTASTTMRACALSSFYWTSCGILMLKIIKNSWAVYFVTFYSLCLIQANSCRRHFVMVCPCACVSLYVYPCAIIY